MRDSVRRAFAVDVDKYYAIGKEGRRGLGARLSLWLLNSELHCVACYRLGQWTNQLRSTRSPSALLPLLVYKVWNRWITRLHHTEIDPRAEIGPGFYLMHRTGVTIGPSRIGANCVIHQFVTIGQRVARLDRGVPLIGDNVWIGPNAVITGGIEIGRGVTISAGSVLTKSVPDRCLVAGNPARVVLRDYDNTSIINYSLHESGKDAPAP